MELVSKVYKGGEHVPDIIAISSEPSPILYVIEIKNEGIDDRALGQILRYYQVVRNICDRSVTRCNARRVTPVLVVPPTDGLSFWDSVPFHFREVVEIYFWRSNSDGSIELVDGKACLRRMARGRVFSAP